MGGMQQPQGSGVEDRVAVGSGQGQGAGSVWALPGEESISPVCIRTQEPPVWAWRDPVMLITARWAARGQPAEAGPAGSGCEALEVGASVGEPLQPRWERLTSERPAPLPQDRKSTRLNSSH